MEKVQVLFSVNGAEIKGKIVWDEKSRKKIVLIAGYQSRKAGSWQNTLPQDGEEWVCQVIRDTKPDNQWIGALICRLVRQVKERFFVGYHPDSPEFFGAKSPTVWKQRGVFREEVRQHQLPEKVRAEFEARQEKYDEARSRILVELIEKYNPSAESYRVGGFSKTIRVLLGRKETGLYVEWYVQTPNTDSHVGGSWYSWSIGENILTDQISFNHRGEAELKGSYSQVVKNLGEPKEISHERGNFVAKWEICKWGFSLPIPAVEFIRSGVPYEIEDAGSEGVDVVFSFGKTRTSFLWGGAIENFGKQYGYQKPYCMTLLAEELWPKISEKIRTLAHEAIEPLAEVQQDWCQTVLRKREEKLGNLATEIKAVAESESPISSRQYSYTDETGESLDGMRRSHSFTVYVTEYFFETSSGQKVVLGKKYSPSLYKSGSTVGRIPGSDPWEEKKRYLSLGLKKLEEEIDQLRRQLVTEVGYTSEPDPRLYVGSRWRDWSEAAEKGYQENILVAEEIERLISSTREVAEKALNFVVVESRQQRSSEARSESLTEQSLKDAVDALRAKFGK